MYQKLYHLFLSKICIFFPQSPKRGIGNQGKAKSGFICILCGEIARTVNSRFIYFILHRHLVAISVWLLLKS